MTTPTDDTGGYTIPPALQDIYDALDHLKALERPILCHPDDQQRVTDAIRQRPDAGLYPIKVTNLIPSGTIYLINRDPLDDWKRQPPDFGVRFYPNDNITPLPTNKASQP